VDSKNIQAIHAESRRWFQGLVVGEKVERWKEGGQGKEEEEMEEEKEKAPLSTLWMPLFHCF
jgi:hypothetical protein